MSGCNPYGILPVTFVIATRQFGISGPDRAMDVVVVDLATNVAQMELSLAIRF